MLWSTYLHVNGHDSPVVVRVVLEALVHAIGNLLLLLEILHAHQRHEQLRLKLFAIWLPIHNRLVNRNQLFMSSKLPKVVSVSGLTTVATLGSGSGPVAHPD